MCCFADGKGDRCHMSRCPRCVALPLHCFALLCIALHCSVLACNILHCFALHCFALHCLALLYFALGCIALHFPLRCFTLLGFVFRCFTLHCFDCIACFDLQSFALHCFGPKFRLHCLALLALLCIALLPFALFWGTRGPRILGNQSPDRKAFSFQINQGWGHRPGNPRIRGISSNITAILLQEEVRTPKAKPN